ncbi:MAG TPA: 2-C-methyl-D-erythritol 4-phosphate cytidylyltransferase, partial [Anaerovoracaceae bacterium]|nr:2-C-methyl-D-erythritol 4-phosphate cytidylyltransferase [Anaerovoracaceae bacterium]
MYENTRVYVIIVAAGLGKRMAANLPKQFLQIEGKTIVERTVARFKNLSCIDGIIVVTHPDYVDLCCSLFESQRGITIVSGGAQRQDSVYMGLQGLAALKDKEQGGRLDDGDIILIHDGVRPFVTTKEIEDVVKDAYEFGATVDAVPTKDTVRIVDESAANHLAAGQFPKGKDQGHQHASALSRTLDRSLLYNVQTPQGFRKHIIFGAYEKAMAEGFYGTDDGSLVERGGYPVAITTGDYGNIKITTKEDLQMCQAAWGQGEELRGRSSLMESGTRIGTGFDVHR